MVMVVVSIAIVGSACLAGNRAGEREESTTDLTVNSRTDAQSAAEQTLLSDGDKDGAVLESSLPSSEILVPSDNEETQGSYSIERTEIQPPIMISPQEGWEVTDYALTFTWQRQSYEARESDEDDEDDKDGGSSWSIDAYQLQVSSTIDFAETFIDIVHGAPGTDQSRIEQGDEFDEESKEIKDMLQYWTETTYSPSTVLEVGTWFWRVRAADIPNEPWSETVSFTTSSDTTKTAPNRLLSADTPLFSFDMYDSDGGGWGDAPDWKIYWDFFPADIKPYTAFAIPHDGWGDYHSPARGENGEVVTYAEFIQPLTDLNIPVLIKTGGPDGDPQNYLSTAELENLYKNHPNVQGVVTGENTWQAIDG